MRAARFLSVVLFLILATTSWSATVTAGSCSYADVSSALSGAADGDTVVIPAGSATWSLTLTITKAITLQGAGNTATIIIAASAGTQLINISPGANKAIRVTGIRFEGGTYQVGINGSTTGSFVLDKVRIDHCSFINGKDNLTAWGWVEGLIDHNHFLNGNRDVYVIGDNRRSWDREIAAGTSHALFIEDNVFQQTNAGGGGLNENVYHFGGGRSVIRYNDFNSSEYTAYDAALIDSHGEQPYSTGPGTSDRGQPLIEVYNNTFRYHHTYRVAYFRGGSIIFHDNAFTFATSSVEIVLSEEECWYSVIWLPNRTAWPAQDQVANSFFWNNTRNGAAITDVTLLDAKDSVFIQKNRDYFMHAPASSGGSESFTGARKGGSQTAPTASDTGSMVFSPTGPNAYYPYTPYVYPHPLQDAGGAAPQAPSGLRIKG